MKVEQINKMNMDELMSIISLISKLKYNRHFTILSFTTHYKGSFGTITERNEIDNLMPYDNLKDLLIDMICDEL